MKQFAMIWIMCIVAASAVDAVEDNPGNRLIEANRFLSVTPPEEMVADMTKNMSQSVPEARRPEFVAVMTTHLDLVSLRKTMLDAMVKHFSANELKALADFYGSPIGKSAMKKFGPYMGDVMPKLQAEVMAAFTAFMKAENPGK
jgi:hypothetical protein